MDKIKNILVGPFVGDFKSEILDFRPFCRWIYETLKPDRIFVSTHFNRAFLYEDFATVVPIYEDLSRDELNQNGYIHNSISQKEILIISRKIKNDVLKLIYPDKSLYSFNLPYTKTQYWLPLYKKIFTPIKTSKNKNKNILYIPSINEKYAVVNELYKHLLKNKDLNIIVAGDMKTHLHENNIMLKNITYFQDIYKEMIENISNASIVITPNSHWTILSLLQKTPVFSWGPFSSYYINNNMPNNIITNEVSLNFLKPMIDNFLVNRRKNYEE